MRTLVAAMALMMTAALHAEEPDYKALYLKSNEAARLWREKAAMLADKLDDAEQKARGFKAAVEEHAATISGLEAKLTEQSKPVMAVEDKAPGDGRKPVKVNAALPGNTWIHLVNYGGPNTHVMLTDVQMTYIMVRFNHTGPARKFAIPVNRDRVLIHSDGHGCETYYVKDNLRRPANGGIFEFSHTAESVWYPGHNVRGGNDRSKAVHLPVATR